VGLRSGGPGEPETRAYLLDGARDFHRLMCSTLLNDDEHGEEWAEFASGQLSPRVEMIAAGKAVHLSRFELPPGHPLSAPGAGRPTDELVLGEDNVVREARR
jgi:hypothetical protein